MSVLIDSARLAPLTYPCLKLHIVPPPAAQVFPVIVHCRFVSPMAVHRRRFSPLFLVAPSCTTRLVAAWFTTGDSSNCRQDRGLKVAPRRSAIIQWRTFVGQARQLHLVESLPSPQLWVAHLWGFPTVLQPPVNDDTLDDTSRGNVRF
jgi:hypothetical protein